MESLSSHKKMKDMMDSICNGEQVRGCSYCIKWKVCRRTVGKKESAYIVKGKEEEGSREKVLLVRFPPLKTDAVQCRGSVCSTVYSCSEELRWL